ncbi:hypothetical protein Q2467_25610, partial [Escherichia coli]|nr:hypothetical protein [Escherichia coli]
MFIRDTLKPTPGFVDEARHQQEIRYKILAGKVRDLHNQDVIAYFPEDVHRLAVEGKVDIGMSMLNAYHCLLYISDAADDPLHTSDAAGASLRKKQNVVDVIVYVDK